MKNRLIETHQENSFLNLLLDENLCAGVIYVPEEWVREAGGIHPKLKGKRKYELLLRIAAKHGFAIEQTDEKNVKEYVRLGEQEEEPLEALKTDCYIIGKYSGILQESGCFEAAVSGIIEQSRIYGVKEEILLWLEHMVRHSRTFDILEEAVSTVLIYKGTDVCNNMLNVFAEQFGQALEKKGQRVEYFDEQKEPLETLTKYIGRHFKAVFGVQTYLFGIKMADGVTYLHEKIKGPKLHLILDHPIWLRKQLEFNYEDFYVLCHDRNYVRFVVQHYGKNAIHFPIPGMRQETSCRERKYDISFVGSMGDYRQQLGAIREMEMPDRYLANRFLLMMRKEKNLSAEQAFDRVFPLYEDRYAGEDKIDVFYRMRKVIYLVMDYYRYQILKTILDSGIQLDVFGDFWKTSALKDYSNIICHSGVTVEESLTVFAQSKLSLNVMSWHKDGFTERVANIMLAHAVLVTDRTGYLEEIYKNGEELIMFSLDKLEELPEKIRAVLGDSEIRQKIAESGYRKTLHKHTWETRTEEVLEFLETL